MLYSKKEQLTKITDPENKPRPSFSMFIVGQTTKEENPFASWSASYAYDEFNQMIKSSGEAVVENRYNGEGLRVEKTVKGATTRYLYEADKVVLEVDQEGQQTARNLYGTNLISRTIEDTTLYYLYNGHGDVTELIDTAGTVQAAYTYDAFGVPKTTTGTADNPYRYAEYQYDEESGLYYLNARMYNPIIARFMQEDTYRGESNDPLSLNLYAYCSNNPVIYTDPSGHVVTKWDKKNLKAKQIRVIEKATKAYIDAAKTGNSAGMAAAHASAEAARDTGRSIKEKGSSSGYTYVEQSDGTLTLNSEDANTLGNVIKGGASMMNGLTYLPERVINLAKDTDNVSSNVTFSDISSDTPPDMNSLVGSLSTVYCPPGVKIPSLEVPITTTLKFLKKNIPAQIFLYIWDNSTIVIDDVEGDIENEHKIGENGTKTTSETVGQNGKTERVDVENPNPGQRDGQIHIHGENNKKYVYDIVNKELVDAKTGEVAGKSVQKLLNEQWVKKAIEKGLKYLGE